MEFEKDQVHDGRSPLVKVRLVETQVDDDSGDDIDGDGDNQG